METDLLVIGSGIAGFSFALKMASARPDLSIVLLNKGGQMESNTRYAQGGIAVVKDRLRDSFQQHISDTLNAGGGHCNRQVVEMVVRQAPDRLEELIRWGVEFDTGDNCGFELGLEGGHSCPRILHHKDITGLEIERKLWQAVQRMPNIRILHQHMAIDLLVSAGDENTPVCMGARVLDICNREVSDICAKVTLLATGGSGQVYGFTTNPAIATGDGVAMAAKAGATISDMQFIQFHPTALFGKNSQSGFLISEAVRGFGAHIVNGEGRRFVFDSDSRGELATRDIVSAAIAGEMQRSGQPFVYLDCRHLNPHALRSNFPHIVAHCLSVGLDPGSDLLPVCPAAHYQCGGISTDKCGRTNIKHLYAIGECARSGLHGSNRLASNSLLEAVVFAHEAFRDVVRHIDNITLTKISMPGIVPYKHSLKNGSLIRKRIQDIMSAYAGVVKTQEGLIQAKSELDRLEDEFQACFRSGVSAKTMEIKNMLTVGRLIVQQSLEYYYKGSEKALQVPVF